MSTKTKNTDDLVAQNPLILRSNRLMEAFAKSDDERDFYVDRQEGFIVYVDLDKPHADLAALERVLKQQSERFCLVPKLTFYETKKIMEGFVNEKVYDIDTKERLLDIISSKSARDNFLEFIYDHHAEQEKWQQYYQERSRIRIIEWLRKNHFQFVFEEDLDLNHLLLDKIKASLFEKHVGKDIENARKTLLAKAKTYYSNEALNPRPKRGRPPKQVAKQEVEPQASADIYTSVPPEVRPFLFTPPVGHAWLATFSSKFENEEQLLAGRKTDHQAELNVSLENLNKKLESLRQISHRLVERGLVKPEEVGINEERQREASLDGEERIAAQKSRQSKNQRSPVAEVKAKPRPPASKLSQRPAKKTTKPTSPPKSKAKAPNRNAPKGKPAKAKAKPATAKAKGAKPTPKAMAPARPKPKPVAARPKARRR